MLTNILLVAVLIVCLVLVVVIHYLWNLAISISVVTLYTATYLSKNFEDYKRGMDEEVT